MSFWQDLCLSAAIAFQQAGLVTTTAGNAGFITCLYVVIVPLVLWIFWHERPSPIMGAAIPLAIGGGFLLSTGGSFRVQPGDVLVFAGSFFWAMHVIIIAKAQGRIAPLPFALGQFVLCGVLNLLTGAFFEHPSQADVAVGPACGSLYSNIFDRPGIHIPGDRPEAYPRQRRCPDPQPGSGLRSLVWLVVLA